MHNSLLDTFYKNSFDLTFNKFQTLISDSKHYVFIYRCMMCGKFLLSKTGANMHCCIQSKISQQQNSILVRHQEAFQTFLRFIATSNISFRAAENNYLNKTFQILDPSFSIPHKDKLCKELIDFSKRIHYNTLQKISNKYVSLLIDGCSRWKKKYQGIVVFTSERLYVFSLINTPNSTSATLANVISSVVKELKRNNTHVVAVCTDNARSNIAALNHKKNSAQQLSGEHFIRQPCAAHTANLAIKDTFESDDDFGFVSKVIDFLIRNKPEGSITEGFSPSFHTERWISLYTCTQFVRKKLNLYQNLTNQEIDEAIKLIENSIGWENLENILQIMWILIEKMERNYSSIADIVPSYLEAINNLNAIQTNASQKMSNNLKKRFYGTLSMNLPMLAFMFTKNGLEYFREFQNLDENILKSALNGLIGYQRERKFNKINIELNRFAFINYIKYFDILNNNTHIKLIILM